MYSKNKIIFFVIILNNVFVSLLDATTIKGIVKNKEGVIVSGAMVSVSTQNMQTTVYSGSNGEFNLNFQYPGQLKLRVRSQFYNDYTLELGNLEKSKTIQNNIKLENLKSPRESSDSLTASAHSSQLEFSSADVKASFISQCNYCHQIGNALTRRPRPKLEWESTIDRMIGYMALLNDREKKEVANTFEKGFKGEIVKNIQSYEYNDSFAYTKIEEWFFGDGVSFPHDAEIGSDGMFYAADEGHDVIWEISPQTGMVNKYPLPDVDGLPIGGNFSALQLPIGVYNGKHGPHSLAEDKFGNYWITNALSGYLSSFNIHSKEHKLFKVPGDALYPHTIRIDQKGIIWFTQAISNSVVRFDPQNQSFTVVNLPKNGFIRWLMESTIPFAMKFFASWPGKNLPIVISPHRWASHGKDVMNLPYGIDVHPIDGSIWYAKLLANKIGRIDPMTLQIKEIDVPLSGPRRPRFDARGILWIPAFDHGAVMKFNTETEKFDIYKMPTLAPGEWEAPYALNVHPKTGEVWITSNTSDRLFRFNPQTEKFLAYPLPTRVTWMRDIAFTEEGKICNSSSNLPSYAIEGGRPSIICISFSNQK